MAMPLQLGVLVPLSDKSQLDFSPLWIFSQVLPSYSTAKKFSEQHNAYSLVLHHIDLSSRFHRIGQKPVSLCGIHPSVITYLSGNAHTIPTQHNI